MSRRSSRRRNHAMAVLLVFAGTVSACGNGGGETPYTERASAVCAKHQDEIEEVRGRLRLLDSPDADPLEVARTTRDLAEILNRMVRELRAIDPPATDELAYQRLLRLSRATVEGQREFSHAVADRLFGDLRPIDRHLRYVAGELQAQAESLGIDCFT